MTNYWTYLFSTSIAYSETCPVMHMRPHKHHRISHFGLHKWYEIWLYSLFFLDSCVSQNNHTLNLLHCFLFLGSTWLSFAKPAVQSISGTVATRQKWAHKQWVLTSICECWDLVFGGCLQFIWRNENCCTQSVKTRLFADIGEKYSSLWKGKISVDQ